MRLFRVTGLLALMIAPAGAQVTIGGGGGGGIGTRGGSASSAHAMGFAELKLPILPAVRFEAVFVNTTGKGTISLVTSGVFEVPTPLVRPYVIAGWGTYGIEDDGARGGWNVGAGVRTALPTGPGVFAELRRHDHIARDLFTIGIRL
ncbi:MAG TPA: hypothetical protein VG916_11005 [Gemmatimonadaceae bacterium]|nr:hypothetical protein [Gemmatimonadaceae bacterium]